MKRCATATRTKIRMNLDMMIAMTTTTIKMQQCTAVRRTEASQMTVNGCHKHQAPVYDILPSTTAVFSYAIGP